MKTHLLNKIVLVCISLMGAVGMYAQCNVSYNYYMSGNKLYGTIVADAGINMAQTTTWLSYSHNGYVSWNDFGNAYGVTSFSLNCAVFGVGDYYVCLTLYDEDALTTCTVSNTYCLNVSPGSSNLGIQAANPASFNFNAFQNVAFNTIDISYSLVENSRVTIELLDLAGNKVGVLEEGEKIPGEYNTKWEQEISPGIYLLRLNTKGSSITKKILILQN